MAAEKERQSVWCAKVRALAAGVRYTLDLLLSWEQAPMIRPCACGIADLPEGAKPEEASPISESQHCVRSPVDTIGYVDAEYRRPTSVPEMMAESTPKNQSSRLLDRTAGKALEECSRQTLLIGRWHERCSRHLPEGSPREDLQPPPAPPFNGATINSHQFLEPPCPCCGQPFI
jgi:hypothetical protein